MFISNLKICNFMSFVGTNEVTLKQFSAVMYSTEKGKNDFSMAMEFLFGRSLSDLCLNSVEDLYHKCFLDSRVFPVIEVSAVFEAGIIDQSFQIARFVRDGRMVYVLNQDEVNLEMYQDIIRGMVVNNSIRYSCEDFFKALWDDEGIETVISNFIGVDFKYHDLQKELERRKVTERSLEMQKEKHCLVLMKQHADVDKVVDEYQKNLKDQESRRQSTIENLVRLTHEIRDYEPTPPSPMDIQSPALQESLDDLLLDEENDLTGLLSQLMIEEAKLSGRILYNEAKLSGVQDDVSMIQAKKLEKYEIESTIRKLESNNHEVWEEFSASVHEISFELADIEQKLSLGPACVQRLTAYGRLSDWIKCGQFTWIFRAVLGEKLLYGNLIDDRKSAEEFISRLQDLHVSSSQTFIILSEYSPRLKETLFENGERQLPLKNYTEVLTLLSKFKEYGLISSVPALVNRGELCLEALGGDDVIFISTGEYASQDGIFGQYEIRSSKEIPFHETLNCVNEQLQHLEKLSQRSREITTKIFKLRLDLVLAKEVHMRRSKRLTNAPSAVPRVIIPEIFEEYAQLFEDYENSLSRETIGFEDLFSNQMADVNKTKSYLKILKAEVAEIAAMKKEKEEELRSVRERLNHKFQNALKETKVLGNPYILPQPEKDKSALSLASRMKEIEKIINSNEVDELKEGVQWRVMVLENLCMELNNAKREAKHSSKIVQDLFDIRGNLMQPLIQFCNETMADMLQGIWGEPVACELRGVSSLLKMFLSFENTSWIDIMDCSVFLRCVAVLVLFLHTASFRYGVVLLLDDLCDFFPKNDYDAQCVLGNEDVSRFDLMVRIGQAIRTFLAKIRDKVGDSPQKEDLMNLDQVLLFTNDDLAVPTDIQVIIHQDVFVYSDQAFAISAMMNM